jgi:hypothetical protein
VTAAPPDPGRAWTAEVYWRQTGDDARFFVIARPVGSEGATTIAESRPLAWPPMDSASVQALADAARDLHSALASAGWRALPPGRAWYAKRFAWDAAGPRTAAPAEDPTLFGPVPAWPDSTADRWRCEITWDAGWVESRFRALAYRPGGRRGRAIATSSPLRWLLMGRPNARSREHLEAVRSLAGALEAAGWERAGRGAGWYSERFAWGTGGAPPDRLEPLSGRATVGKDDAHAY